MDVKRRGTTLHSNTLKHFTMVCTSCRPKPSLSDTQFCIDSTFTRRGNVFLGDIPTWCTVHQFHQGEQPLILSKETSSSTCWRIPNTNGL